MSAFNVGERSGAVDPSRRSDAVHRSVAARVIPNRPATTVIAMYSLMPRVLLAEHRSQPLRHLRIDAAALRDLPQVLLGSLD